MNPSIFAVALLALTALLGAQSRCRLTADANTTRLPASSNPAPGRSKSSAPHVNGFVRAGGYWYFVAETISTGRELWRTDGSTGGTVLVKDIRPGPGSSNPSWLISAGSGVYFVADDGKTGRELWTSNGSASGTRLVHDINPRSFGGIAESSSPSDLTVLGGLVCFAADDGTHGRELWATNRAVGTTYLVRDIYPGSTGGVPHSSHPQSLRLNNATQEIYFAAQTPLNGRELWETRGTTSTTVLLKDIEPGSRGSAPYHFVNVGNVTVFVAGTTATGQELWRTGGTSASTRLLADIEPGRNGSGPDLYIGAQLQGYLLFSARTATHGREVYRTNGTDWGLVADINTGSASSNPAAMHTVGGNTIYFSATKSGMGAELWKITLGKNPTVALVKDIQPGSNGSSPRDMQTFGGRVIFSATTTAHGTEVWISDGTAAGTYLAKDIHPTGHGNPTGLTVLSPLSSAPRVLFAADDGASGRELWLAHRSGVSRFKDLDPRTVTASSTPGSLREAWGNTLYFSAAGATGERELWSWTPTAGPKLVKNMNSTKHSWPGESASCWLGNGMGQGRAITLFVAYDDALGAELFITDGTAAGTGSFRDIFPGRTSSYPRDLTVCNSRIYFTADDGSGRELWAVAASPIDGNPVTARVEDIVPGRGGSDPRDLTSCRDRLFFTADDGRRGRELWISDDKGTRIVSDLLPGSGGSDPRDLVRCGDKVVFSAKGPAIGRELYVSDGTSTGTRLVADILTGNQSSGPSGLVRHGDRVFFSAYTSRRGVELWATDTGLTTATLVRDIVPGTDSSRPSSLVSTDELLFFVAHEPRTGTEIWSTDGTATGTARRADILPGPDSSTPRQLVSAGKAVYFTAFHPNTGEELYCATRSAVRLVQDIWPGDASSRPGELTFCDGQLLFAADHPLYGRELWVLPGPGAAVHRLGDGSPSGFPEIDATAPVIGGSMTISWNDGPAGYFGIMAVSAPIARPFGVPVSLGAASWLDLNAFIPFVGTAQPSGRIVISLPGTMSVGGRYQVQMWWSGPNWQTSNGLLLRTGPTH